MAIKFYTDYERATTNYPPKDHERLYLCTIDSTGACCYRIENSTGAFCYLSLDRLDIAPTKMTTRYIIADIPNEDRDFVFDGLSVSLDAGGAIIVRFFGVHQPIERVPS